MPAAHRASRALAVLEPWTTVNFACDMTSSSNGRTSRRVFLKQVASATAVGAALVASGCAQVRTTRRTDGPRKRIALIATVVRKYSHAQHFIDRLTEGYGWQGRWHHPEVDLVSLYVDQVPPGDLSRDRAKRFGMRIYPTIGEALALGSSKLAVDGVVLIGEHGKYPRNEKGQTLYPRHRFFSEAVEVFKASGRSVPMFQDKHLSTSWEECVAQVETARALDFPYQAGSSLPVTWRIPSVDLPLGTNLVESVAVCYGGVDSYDFHGLETAQCMSERRAGGESGVKSVRALRGAKVWEALQDRPETERLLFAALARSHSLQPAPDGFTFPAPGMEFLRRASPTPVAYFFEHHDGLRTTLFLLNGCVRDFTYAGRTREGRVMSCQMQLPMPPAISTTADFFNPLVHHIEQMILQRQAPYPIERTLLTSGMTLTAIESLHRGQVPVETPELRVSYQAKKESTFWRA
jgi:hypothetical protein